MKATVLASVGILNSITSGRIEGKKKTNFETKERGRNEF
jgi:hypothetical protein